MVGICTECVCDMDEFRTRCQCMRMRYMICSMQLMALQRGQGIDKPTVVVRNKAKAGGTVTRPGPARPGVSVGGRVRQSNDNSGGSSMVGGANTRSNNHIPLSDGKSTT